MSIHCCEQMRQEAERVCDEHPDRFACPDCLVHYSPQFREYGLIIHDGGTACRQIHFCPWCGGKLPDSLRREWFEAIERLQIDPCEGGVPKAFQSAAWWQSRNSEPS